MFPWIFPAIAFAISLVLTPFIGGVFKKKGVISPDLHKKDNPYVPELVGVAVLASFTISLVGAYLYSGENSLIVTMVAVLLVGTMGIIDHYRPLTPREKVLGLSFIGLIYYVLFPSRGYIFLILVPVLFMAVCNFTNMLAGFNGLEIGVGAIASIGIASVAYINGLWAAFIISASMAAALLGFLYYNMYPARFFPGDAGTLIIGAALFSAVYVGELYLSGVLVFLPYALDAGLKFISVGVMSRHGQEPTRLKNGKLYPPTGGNLSLVRLLLRVRPMGEREVVALIWGIEAVFVVVAITVGVEI